MDLRIFRRAFEGRPVLRSTVSLIGNLNKSLCFEGTDLLPFLVLVHNYTEMSLKA